MNKIAFKFNISLRKILIFRYKIYILKTHLSANSIHSMSLSIYFNIIDPNRVDYEN